MTTLLCGVLDDAYGQYWDDEGSHRPAPTARTTDCQPLHGDATKKRRSRGECDNRVAYARDETATTRASGECALGTDCQDCGPRRGQLLDLRGVAWWN